MDELPAKKAYFLGVGRSLPFELVKYNDIMHHGRLLCSQKRASLLSVMNGAYSTPERL